MALPPQLICIKRKRDDYDEPVTFLRKLVSCFVIVVKSGR